MNKQTRTALELALFHLRICDDHDSDSAEAGAAAIQAIETALKLEDTPSPVIVFVGGGCVTDVMNVNGKSHPCHAVIDYDNADNGQCPVCGLDEFDDSAPCENCGYTDDEHGDNAFECAVKLLQEKE